MELINNFQNSIQFAFAFVFALAVGFGPAFGFPAKINKPYLK